MMTILSLTLIIFRAFSKLQNDTVFMDIDQCNQELSIKYRTAGNSYCFFYILQSIFTYFLKIFLPQSPPFQRAVSQNMLILNDFDVLSTKRCLTLNVEECWQRGDKTM